MYQLRIVQYLEFAQISQVRFCEVGRVKCLRDHVLSSKPTATFLYPQNGNFD
jgi:hypothetical protein